MFIHVFLLFLFCPFCVVFISRRSVPYMNMPKLLLSNRTQYSICWEFFPTLAVVVVVVVLGFRREPLFVFPPMDLVVVVVFVVVEWVVGRGWDFSRLFCLCLCLSLSLLSFSFSLDFSRLRNPFCGSLNKLKLLNYKLPPC